MKTWIIVLACGFWTNCLSAAEINVEKDDSTGWRIYTLRQGATIVRVAPDAGANAFSITHHGIEYFRVPEELKTLPGVRYGNPILYPTPNRVRDGRFTFEGQTYEFPINAGGNFIHGLVHSEPFEVESCVAKGDCAELTCRLAFAPGTQRYQLFPFLHVFRVTIAVRDGAVRWTYEVDNQLGERNLPFGVAFHPYLLYHKSRDETYLHVPATHLMEAEKQLPSGNLLSLDYHSLDARQPRSLRGYSADDVFFGMKPERPASVEFRDVDRGVTFSGSKEFTHLVVWTPDKPFFGIENQTCSTDAHNLAANGKGDVAHLQICRPSEKQTGSVEYRFR